MNFIKYINNLTILIYNLIFNYIDKNIKMGVFNFFKSKKQSVNDTFLLANSFQEDNHEKAIELYLKVLDIILNDKSNIKSGTECKAKFNDNSGFFDSQEYIGLNYIELIGAEVNIIPLGNIYFNLGQSYFNLQIFEKAKDSYSKAVDANSKCPSIFNHSLGCSKIYLGDFTSCIEDFNNSLLKDSDYCDSYYMRAVAYASDSCKFQNIQKAIKDVKKYLDYHPDDNAANKLLNKLTSI